MELRECSVDKCGRTVNLAGYYSIVFHCMQNNRYSVDTLCSGNLSPSHVTGDATGRADMCVRVGGDGTSI